MNHSGVASDLKNLKNLTQRFENNEAHYKMHEIDQ